MKVVQFIMFWGTLCLSENNEMGLQFLEYRKQRGNLLREGYFEESIKLKDQFVQKLHDYMEGNEALIQKGREFIDDYCKQLEKRGEILYRNTDSVTWDPLHQDDWDPLSIIAKPFQAVCINKNKSLLYLSAVKDTPCKPFYII